MIAKTTPIRWFLRINLIGVKRQLSRASIATVTDSCWNGILEGAQLLPVSVCKSTQHVNSAAIVKCEAY